LRSLILSDPRRLNARAVTANTLVITRSGGHTQHGRDGCNLTDAGRKAFLRAWERRLAQEITHPVSGYRVSWRRTIEVQARLLARALMGDIPRYLPIETR